MSDKTIIIIKESVTKKVNELTNEEKCIYDAGFEKGWSEGSLVVFMFITFIVIVVLVAIAIIN